ncbi:MAG: hypothetical protein K2W96_24345 [Gemmataceae bacterium]|nr:hypothetical protein [Gemmataceae bacterium]
MAEKDPPVASLALPEVYFTSPADEDTSVARTAGKITVTGHYSPTGATFLIHLVASGSTTLIAPNGSVGLTASGSGYNFTAEFTVNATTTYTAIARVRIPGTASTGDARTFTTGS